jgi:hypothetical protein
LRSSSSRNQNAKEKEFLSPKGLGAGKLKKIEKLRQKAELPKEESDAFFK